jgi:maleate isomerase
MRIGLIYPPDAANDRDAWRWCPDGVTLLATRTAVDRAWRRATARLRTDPEAIAIPSERALRQAVCSLLPAEPALITYACTSCSFVGPADREGRLRRAMIASGAAIAQTTSGALLDALDALGATSVAVGTPYCRTTTAALGSYLAGRGYTIASLANEPPRRARSDAELARDQMFELAVRADRPAADVVLLSGTDLETFDLIADLEAKLGKPVLTAMQVTMWAALGACGVEAGEVPQALFRRSWQPSRRREP